MIDETGQPVAETCTACWTQLTEDREDGVGGLVFDMATSDASGHFRLHHVHPGVKVSVIAQTQDKGTLQAAELFTDQPQELELTVTPNAMVSIVGWVKGADDSEVTDGSVEVVKTELGPDGWPRGNCRIMWNGRPNFPVEPNGSFRSPGQVPRFGEYSVKISAPGYQSVETPFLPAPRSGAALDFSAIRLIRTRTVAGIVRDSAGVPLAGTEVRGWVVPAQAKPGDTVWTTTTTDPTGRFTLDHLHPAMQLVVVGRDGYRLTGCALPAGATELPPITLFRRDEVIPPEQSVQPIKLDDRRRCAAVGKLAATLLPDVRGEHLSSYHEILSMLVRSNPSAAKAELELVTSASVRDADLGSSWARLKTLSPSWTLSATLRSASIVD